MKPCRAALPRVRPRRKPGRALQAIHPKAQCLQAGRARTIDPTGSRRTITQDHDRGWMHRATLALLVMGGMLALAAVPNLANAQQKKVEAKDQKKVEAKPQPKDEKKAEVKKAEAKPQPKDEKKAEVKKAEAKPQPKDE